MTTDITEVSHSMHRENFIENERMDSRPSLNPDWVVTDVEIPHKINAYLRISVHCSMSVTLILKVVYFEAKSELIVSSPDSHFLR